MVGELVGHAHAMSALSAAVLATEVADPSARGIARHLAWLIREQQLPEGTRLPTVRATAAALHVGASTVAGAWAILRHDRLIRSDGRNGTFVHDLSPPDRTPKDLRADDTEHPVRIDLETSAYDVDLVPDPAPYLAAASARLGFHHHESPDVDADLARVADDDWPFAPQALAVTWGFADALMQLASVAVHPGDRVLVEAACSPQTSAVLEAVQAQVVRVSCDAAGMLPDAVADALVVRPAMIVTQPRMADPLAHRLTDERARDLAGLVAERHVLVVEEDSAASLATRPAASLGSWLPDQTVLVRDYHRSHGPTVRMALVGGAAAVVERLRARQAVTGSFPPALAQRTLAMMLDAPAVQDMVERARWRYARRWRTFARALRSYGVEVPGVDGLAVWVRVPDAEDAVRRLAYSGIHARLGTDVAGPAEGSRHLRLATTGLRFEHDAVARLVASR